MLYRTSGHLSGNRSFSLRVDAKDAADAVAQTAKALSEAKDENGKKVDGVPLSITAKVMEAKGGIYIGEAKKKKAK